MKIQEFAKERNVSYATVFQYIKRHPDLFDGHIGKSNNIVLDDTALQILDERYPRENPVQVICDTEARDRLAVLQEKYISLLEENNRLTQENANSSMTKTVTVKNTGNGTLNFKEISPEHFMVKDLGSLAAGESVDAWVMPREGTAVGEYSDTITYETEEGVKVSFCLLYTSPSPRDA